MAGTVGICVNTSKIHEPIRGYKDVFQSKYAGRIVVVNDSRELVSWALATQGIAPNDITPDNLAKARPILAGWIKLIKKFDSDSPKTDLLAGNVDIGIVWSGEAAMCWRENHGFQYILPAEGAHQFIDNLAIPSGARNLALAHAFIDFTMEPAIAAEICETMKYSSPNRAAWPLLPEAIRMHTAIFPPEDALKRLELLEDLGTTTVLYDRLWTEVKSGR